MATYSDVTTTTEAWAGPSHEPPEWRWIVFRLEHDRRFGRYRISSDGRKLRAILPRSKLAPRFIDWGPRPKGGRD